MIRTLDANAIALSIRNAHALSCEYAESTPGKETTFILSFPTINESETKIHHELNISEHPKINGKVLLVDDETDVREVLREYLISFGLEVDDADDGDAALKKMTETRYDLLITDLKMPHMNGDALIKEIVKLKHPALKIFVITGGILTDYSQEEREIIRLNSHAYLKKPIHEPTLYEAIKRTLKPTQV